MKKLLIVLLSLILFVSCTEVKDNKEEIPLPTKIDITLPKRESREAIKRKEVEQIIERASYYGNIMSFEEAELIYDSVEKELEKYPWLKKPLIYSIIECESEFDKNAYNDKNTNNSIDYGLAQINEITLIDYNNFNMEQITSEQLMNTSINIQVCTWALDMKRTRLIKAGIAPTEENIIKAYNCGESRVKRGRIPQSTLDYQLEVSEKMELWQLS